MADVDIKKQQGKTSQGRPETQGVMERSQGTPAPAVPSLFSLTPRDFLTASPFQLMRRFSEEMDRAFAGFMPSWRMTNEDIGVWDPPIEVTEQDGKYLVCADLPGIRREDVKVELSPEGVLISGERKREREERREGVYRSERSYGGFCRCIPIPEGADVDHARAEFENGVLKVSVPIPKSQRRRREIPIEAGDGKKAA